MILPLQGAPGRLMATTAHYPGGTERIEVIGTLGTAVLDGGHLRVDFVNGDATIEIKADGGTGGGLIQSVLPNQAQQIHRHRGELANQIVSVKLSARQALQIHIGLELRVKLLMRGVITVQLNHRRRAQQLTLAQAAAAKSEHDPSAPPSARWCKYCAGRCLRFFDCTRYRLSKCWV